MSLLKPAAQPWRHTDFSYSRVQAQGYGRGLRHVLRTTALVESRADQYGDYLRAVFATRGAAWRVAIDAWNREEREHGLALQRLCAAVEGEFAAAQLMPAYVAAAPYHDCDGRSVRGSVADELVARCVVEALASTFYRVLRDACTDALGRRLLTTLSQDEARHYGMFAAMLEEENTCQKLPWWRRLRTGLKRMSELSDEQIMAAAWLVEQPATPVYSRRDVARRYQAALYPLYRYVHLDFAARLLAPVLFGSRSTVLVRLLALSLFAGVRLRGALSRAGAVLWPQRRRDAAADVAAGAPLSR